MNISEAKEQTGLTKKAIRFYEEAGLLSVQREEKTGYRIYDDTDIRTLKEIKLFRKIGVPILDIHAILNQNSSITEVLLKQKQELDSQIGALQAKRELLQSVISSNKLVQNSSELIYDIEDIIYYDSADIKKKIGLLDRKDVILAAMGASPQVNDFLQELLPDLDIRAERQKVGRVRMEDIEEAQRKIVIHMNY